MEKDVPKQKEKAQENIQKTPSLAETTLSTEDKESKRLNNIKPYRNKNEVGSKEFGQKREIRKEICPSTNKDKNKIKGEKMVLTYDFSHYSPINST